MRAAFAFLTVLGTGRDPDPTAPAWFPVVGLVLGVAVGGVWWGAGELWPPAVAAVLALVTDLALTGLLHVDGLADTGDGLLVHGADAERRLAIMRAPDVGAYGVAVVVVALLGQFAALASQPADVLLVAGLWASTRALVAVVPAVVPYARVAGLAGGIFTGPVRTWPLVGVVVALALAGVGAGVAGVAGVVAGMAAAVAVVIAARRRLGGYTGDVLGAAIVAGQAAGLLVAAAEW